LNLDQPNLGILPSLILGKTHIASIHETTSVAAKLLFCPFIWI
jgi:hypothetical protein